MIELNSDVSPDPADVMLVLAATAFDADDQGNQALVDDVNTIIASYVATDPE